MDKTMFDELRERFDEIYVRRDACDKAMDAVSEKLAKNDERYAVINTKLSLLLWGVGVLCTAIIGYLVKLAFGG